MEENKEVEVIDAEATPVTEKKKLTRKEKRKMDLPGNPLQGRKLFKVAKLFFIFSCVVTALVGATFALPFITVVIGLISVIMWLAVVIFVTLLTVGLIWTVQDFKNMNTSWMNFNSNAFNSGGVIADAMVTVIPVIAGIGLSIVIVAWILLGVGYKKDEFRRKNYKIYLITLIFVTVLFLVLAIISMVAKFSS